MRAEIIAIGSELLGPAKLDTNSLFLTRQLRTLGIRVERKTVIGDELAGLTAVLAEAAARSRILITTGGLGPTADDRTRLATAAALGRSLLRDEAMEAQLRRYFAARRRTMPEANLRQADRVDGAQWLPNPAGSAAGQWIETGGAGAGLVILLPGPGEEMRRMFEREVRPRLMAWAPRQAVATRTLKVVGLPESEVDAMVAPLYREVTNPETTILAAGPGLVEFHLVGWADEPAAAEDLVEGLARALALRLGPHVYAHGEATLEAVVGEWLRRRGETVAVAESCTGGMIGELLTRVAGASEFFVGGAICYSNALKQQLARVRADTLAQHGAVSAPTAAEMAEGIRSHCHADWALAVTGIAGPGGGSPQKPVGTVFTALAGGDGTRVQAHQLAGGRERIRRWTAALALDQLRRALLAAPPSPKQS